MQAVVLAAGKGTRLKPLTNHKPKALAEINSKPMLWFVLDSLYKAGIKETIIITGHLGEQIEQYFGNTFEKMKLRFVPQKIQLGTAHALLQAKKIVKKDFLMTHCDVIASAKDWKELKKIKNFAAVMGLRKEEEPEHYGVVLTRGKNVAEIIEKPEKPKTDLVNSACYKFSPKIFEALEATKINPKRNEFELTDTLQNLAAKKKVGYYLLKETVFDISNLEDLRDAEEKLV